MAVPLFAVGVAVWHVTNRLDQHRGKLNASSDTPELAFTAPHSDRYTLELGRWIRDNTSSESLLASNSFCCKGTQWLDTPLAQLREIDANYSTLRNREAAYGGANYLLPAVTHRRFLLAGPRFFVTLPMSSTDTSTNSTAETISWLDASVGFGDSGDREVGQVLKAIGASYFIVDKFALSEPGLRPDFERLRYENSRYLVIEL